MWTSYFSAAGKSLRIKHKDTYRLRDIDNQLRAFYEVKPEEMGSVLFIATPTPSGYTFFKPAPFPSSECWLDRVSAAATAFVSMVELEKLRYDKRPKVRLYLKRLLHRFANWI